MVFSLKMRMPHLIMTKTTLYIPTMNCTEKMNLIKNRLQSIPNIQHLAFNLIQQEVTLSYEKIDISTIQEILETIDVESHIQSDSPRSERLKLPQGVTKKDWIIGLSGLLALAAEVIALSTHTEHSIPVILQLLFRC